MKAFSEILSDDFYKLDKILKENHNYFAHRKDKPLKKELLSTHTDLTLNYFQKLVFNNGLENIIDLQILDFVKSQGFDDDAICLFIKEAFVDSLYFHDFGKINENFQSKKMLNKCFVEIENGIGTKHSILSSLLYLSHYFHKVTTSSFDSRAKNLLYYLSFLFVHAIKQHHGKLINPKLLDFEIIKTNTFSHYLNHFLVFENYDFEKFYVFFNNYFERILEINRNIENSFLTYSLVKLNSSLLTAADYYATNEFMLDLRVSDFGVINKEFRNKITKNVKSISYNSDLYEKYDFYNSISIREIEDRTGENLNKLRQCLAANIIAETRNSLSKKLFYIEAPTGSGKTNLSFLFLAELLEKKEEITKVFYVFPFTTLITQTFDSIKKSIALSSAEIIEVHSKAPFCASNDDSGYGSEKLNFIDSLFINFPLSLMSHITFFDILTSTEKNKTYILHRIANSVVIIDEIQSYSPTEWDKINYLIQKFSEYYNITFLVMSATLPKISKLLIEKTAKDDFKYLVKRRDDYFKNPNFSQRVKVDTSLLPKLYTKEKISKSIFEISESYYHKYGFIKTIVEFITKKRAYEFYSYLINSNLFAEYKIFLISGTILHTRRMEIIDFLKNTNNIERTIVVSTQVIEAGVDIDMDIGFKDKSIIDSEEQLAGRINRNAIKKESKLYLFNSGDAQNVYKADLRYKLRLSTENYLSILAEKNFEYYYKLVFDQINLENIDDYRSRTLPEFIAYIRKNDYKSVCNSFELIKNNSVSIFIPLKIKAKYFSNDEIIFINNFTSKVVGKFVDGYDIWNIYEEIIMNKIEDFILQKINIKIISSIISKFTFSIWKNPNEYNILRHYALDGEEKYGFLMLTDYEKIYSYEAGLISEIDKEINFIGF